ncbi:MAG: ABC transporter permease [Candidatus Thorarchaeota archaeon]
MIRAGLAICLSDLRGFFRNRSTFALALVFPLVFVAVMGFAFGQEGERAPISVGYVDNDDLPVAFNGENTNDSAHAVTLLSIMRGEFEYEGIRFSFDLREFQAENEIITSIKDGDLRIGFVLPANFTESLKNGTLAKIKVFQDVSNPNTAIIDRETVEGVIQGYCNAEIEKTSETEFSEAVVISRTEVAPKAGDITYVEYMIPGMISVAILWVAIQRASTSLARERDHGTIYRLLGSPTPPAAILIGKGLSVFITTLISVAIVILTGIMLFHVELVWWRLELLLFIGLAALNAIGLGLIISGWAKDEQTASSAVTLVSLPLQFFLDAFFPVDFFPEPAPTIAYYIPLTRASSIFRDILIYDRPLLELLADAIYVSFWGIALFLIGVFMLWRRMSEQ